MWLTQMSEQEDTGNKICDGSVGWELWSLTPVLLFLQLYQKLNDKMEAYQQKVNVVTRDNLYRRN